MPSLRPQPIPVFATGQETTGDRPKALPRTLNGIARIGARLLDVAMIATGAQNTVVAAHLGVTEPLVRALRTGEKPLTIDRVMGMPRSVALAVIDAMRDEIEEAAPMSTLEAERFISLGVKRDGEVATILIEARLPDSPDGERISECERKDLIRANHEALKVRQDFGRGLVTRSVK